MTTDPDVSLVIIDDNPGSLELLSTSLEGEGIRISTSQDPEEAIEIIFREHQQIVLTDSVMPKAQQAGGAGSRGRIPLRDRRDPDDRTTKSAVEAIRRADRDGQSDPYSVRKLDRKFAKVRPDDSR